MNGVTRVGLSVLLLGTCALAMRFSMVKTPVLESVKQNHDAKIAVGKIEEINLHFEAVNSQKEVYIRSGQKGFISGRYQASQADHLFLSGKTTDGALDVNFNAGKGIYTSFLIDRPEDIGITTMNLPPEVPLFIDAYINDSKPKKVVFDLRGLNIQKFTLPKIMDSKIDTLVFYTPVGTSDTEMEIGGLINKANVWVAPKSKGSLMINARNGQVNIVGHKNTAVYFSIHGSAINAEAFAHRVRLSGFHRNSQPMSFQDQITEQTTKSTNRFFIMSNDPSSKSKIQIHIELNDSGTINYSEQP
jgi:hypothetical protein